MLFGDLILQLIMQSLEPGRSILVVERDSVLIFSMLAGGWKSSASRKIQSSFRATCIPTAVFPEPATPMRTTA